MSRYSYRKDPNVCQICWQEFKSDDDKTSWVCGHDYKTYIHKSCSPDDKWLNDFKAANRDIKIDKLID